jgi:hypothetical protein
MRKLKATLSADGLKKLARDFRTEVGSFNLKCDTFVERLIEIGIPVVEENITSFKGDSSKNWNYYYEIHREKDSAWGKLIIEDKDILFIEFGAGIHYNNGNAHPQASELGYGVGTYPGQTQAINPGYWWYKDNGGVHFSLGTEATMPVYKAYAEIVSRVGEIAREVFGNG